MVCADCRKSDNQPALTIQKIGKSVKKQAKIVNGILRLFLYICCSPKG